MAAQLRTGCYHSPEEVVIRALETPAEREPPVSGPKKTPKLSRRSARGRNAGSGEESIPCQGKGNDGLLGAALEELLFEAVGIDFDLAGGNLFGGGAVVVELADA